MFDLEFVGRSPVPFRLRVQFGVTNRLLIILFVLTLGVAFAMPYSLKPGDTLSSIARAFQTDVPTEDALEVGPRLEVPGAQRTPELLPVSSNGLSITHRASAKPGEPVTVRIAGSLERPTVLWGVGRPDVETPGQGKSGTLLEGEMQLVMVRADNGSDGKSDGKSDRQDWVGVGRDILGTPAETVKLEVRSGSQTATPRVLTSSLKLLGDPRPLQDVFMSKEVMATLTDENRTRERTVLSAAYKRSETTPRAWTKTFAWPVPDRQISPFGQNRRYERGGDLNYHYGEDLVGRTGDPIKASNDGTVVIAGCYAIRGCLTGINHGAGLVSSYFHQSAILVKVGQRVLRGELIGRAGKTGFANGPHLHLEFRVRGEATDPRAWMGKVWP